MTKNKVLPKHINNSAEQAFVSARSADYELAQKAAAGDMRRSSKFIGSTIATFLIFAWECARMPPK
ncbi:MAG: hypothetical protein M3R14_11085 [Acidobacteriota bacterium]|nr:hypothetical protein [Acidobacteriota bacterium]